jgi:fibronectin type III domain protein
MTVHVPNIDESLATLAWQLQALKASRDALRELLDSPWLALAPPRPYRLSGVWNTWARRERLKGQPPPPLPRPVDLMTVADASSRCAVEPKMLYRALHRRTVTAYHLSPTGPVHVSLRQVEDWQDTRPRLKERAMTVGLTLAICLLASTAHAQARTVTIEWDASPPTADAVVDGYVISRGSTAPGIYGTQTLVDAKTTQLTVVGLLTTSTYYFVVQAINPFGERSLRSNELIVPPVGTIPPTKPPPTPTGGGFRTPSVPLKGPQP